MKLHNPFADDVQSIIPGLAAILLGTPIAALIIGMFAMYAPYVLAGIMGFAAGWLVYRLVRFILKGR